jgi:hypothetical protein
MAQALLIELSVSRASLKQGPEDPNQEQQRRLLAKVRFGSVATRSSQQQVGRCPLCHDSNQIRILPR